MENLSIQIISNKLILVKNNIAINEQNQNLRRLYSYQCKFLMSGICSSHRIQMLPEFKHADDTFCQKWQVLIIKQGRNN